VRWILWVGMLHTIERFRSGRHASPVTTVFFRTSQHCTATTIDFILVGTLRDIGYATIMMRGDEYMGRDDEKDDVPKKTIHAIAHFDFDGSCDDCPVSNFGYRYICRLGKLNVECVPEGKRHEHCPLCIEE